MIKNSSTLCCCLDFKTKNALLLLIKDFTSTLPPKTMLLSGSYPCGSHPYIHVPMTILSITLAEPRRA